MDDWLYIPSPGMLFEYMTERWREEQESKPITLDSTLSAALNKCPVQWLDGICLCVGLDPKAQRNRKDRVKAVVAHLSSPEVLRAVVASVPEQSKQALAHVLEKEGWTKARSLTRQFGTMDDVGWFWDEEKPPTSAGPIAGAWSTLRG